MRPLTAAAQALVPPPLMRRSIVAAISRPAITPRSAKWRQRPAQRDGVGGAPEANTTPIPVARVAAERAVLENYSGRVGLTRQ